MQWENTINYKFENTFMHEVCSSIWLEGNMQTLGPPQNKNHYLWIDLPQNNKLTSLTPTHIIPEMELIYLTKFRCENKKWVLTVCVLLKSAYEVTE